MSSRRTAYKMLPSLMQFKLVQNDREISAEIMAKKLLQG